MEDKKKFAEQDDEVLNEVTGGANTWEGNELPKPDDDPTRRIGTENIESRIGNL